MDLVRAVADLEVSPDLHLVRLLILINTFGKDNPNDAIEGLTKLAKLDFLLRYPVMLQRALVEKKCSTRDVQLLDYERYCVESEMVRYRFGPWDHRYREFLNMLCAKGLVSVAVVGRKVNINITEKGRDIADQLVEEVLFEQYSRRANILKRHFDLTATNLMNFIYKAFPEIISLRSNTPIST